MRVLFALPHIKQLEAAVDADVRVFPHDHLFLSRNGKIPQPLAVVIDESFWRKSIRTTAIPLDRLTALRSWRWFNGKKAADPEEIEDLEHLSRKVRNALEASEHPRDHGVTAEDCKLAAKIEFAGAEFPPITPGMSYDTQKRKLAAMQKSEALRLWRFWKVLEAEIGRSGPLRQIRLVRDHAEGRSTDLHDYIFVHWHREPLIPDVPALLIDADLDEEITRKFFPRLKAIEIQVDRRAEVIQVRDTACSRNHVLSWGGAPEDEKKRAANRLADVQALINAEAASGKRVLLITYKPAAVQLRAPAGCAIEHFGNIRGLDRYRDFDTVIIAGREQPPHQEAENLARALFADAPEPLSLCTPGERLRKERRSYRMRDGSHAGVDVEVHPDPRVQRVLEQIRERESAQGIDRLRLVHRDQPACVIILSSLVLDITVDRLVTWAEIIPNRFRRAAARGPALPLSDGELARCFPDLWRSAGAVEQDRRRQGKTPYGTLIEYLFGERRGFRRAEYRREGARGPAAPAAIYGPGDPRAALESVVGPVAVFRLIDAPGEAAEEAVQPSAEPPPSAPEAPVSGSEPPASEPEPSPARAVPPARPPPRQPSVRGHPAGYISSRSGVWIPESERELDDEFYPMRKSVRERIERYGWPGIPDRARP